MFFTCSVKSVEKVTLWYELVKIVSVLTLMWVFPAVALECDDVLWWSKRKDDTMRPLCVLVAKFPPVRSVYARHSGEIYLNCCWARAILATLMHCSHPQKKSVSLGICLPAVPSPSLKSEKSSACSLFLERIPLKNDPQSVIFGKFHEVSRVLSFNVTTYGGDIRGGKTSWRILSCVTWCMWQLPCDEVTSAMCGLHCDAPLWVWCTDVVLAKKDEFLWVSKVWTMKIICRWV